MKVPTMSVEGEFQGLMRYKEEKDASDEEDETIEDPEPTEFPCNVCSATFVTRMSLIRHMILHEDDNQGNNEEYDDDEAFDESASPLVTHIPEQNLLETILKNGSKSVIPSSFSINGSTSTGHAQDKNNSRISNGRGTAGGRPIPNLKPLPSLIQIKVQQQEKNFQCQLCGVWFWKKEDLSRHVTRTHGSAKFTCPYCHRNISRRDHLKRHIKNVHPEYCTATEVGPFVNQGAGRPPKQPREMVGMIEEKPIAMKRIKLTNDTKSKLDSNVSEIPALQQNFEGVEIHNQIHFINESKIETNFDEDEMREDDSQFGIDSSSASAGYNQEEEELFDDVGNEEYDDNDTMEFKPEVSPHFPSVVEEDYEDNFEMSTLDEMLSEGNDVNSDNEPDEENRTSEFDESNLKPIVGSAERKFKCELCDAAFMSKINMQRHMSTHSVARPHKCSVCGKGFLRKEHLTKHLSSVHSGLKYRCQFCRKDISRKDHLLRHIRNCHPHEFMGMSLDMIDSEPQISQVPAMTLSDNPNMRVAALSCDMCSEIFNHIDELCEHQSDAHSDIRKFKCEECPKAFKRKEHLVKHQSTHAAPVAKTYSCSECNKVFPSLDIAHAHLRQAHAKKSTNLANSSSTPVLSLPCNLCDNTFQQRAHLLQHLKAYHGVSNPERRFTDASFNATTSNTNVSSTMRQMIPVLKSKSKQIPFPESFIQKPIGKPQIRSLLGMRTTIAKNDEGSLGSLMGLINRGSISLSLSKIA